jgi:hypothetical protein
MIRNLTLVTCAFAAFAVAAQVPRTKDGHPDLQGIWTNVTVTPLERPVDLAPTLRQKVKTHFSLNGELSYGVVTQAVHEGI